MRRLISITLALLVFSGSIGAPLYSHTCSHDNVTIHTLFLSPDHCVEMDVQPVEQHASCCAVKTPEQQVKEKCCSEQVTHLSMQFNFFEHWHMQAAIIPQFVPEITHYLPYTVLFSEDREVLYASNTDPPPLSGREILHRICIWRL